MRRARLFLLAVGATALAGCYAANTPSDARDAGRIDALVRAATCPGVSYPFSRDEVYLETASPACASERPACLVFRLEGDPHPECTEQCAEPAEARLRAFCTCRCDGETPCACAAGEVCTPTGFTFGSFCVPSAIASER